MIDFFDKEKLGKKISDEQHSTEEVADRLNKLDRMGSEAGDKIMFLVKLPGDTGWRYLTPTLCHCDVEMPNPDGYLCNERFAVVTHGDTLPYCPHHPPTEEEHC